MKADALRRYDLNLFVTLYVLLDECNVSRAAERLHLSQSAISRSLGRLREIFNDELFVRRPHGLQPTARVLELQAELAEALNLVAQMIAPPVFDPASCTQNFSVSMMEHLGIQLMPRVVTRLREEAPAVSINVQPWSRSSVKDMANGRLDLSINILPLDRPDLHSRIIAPVPAAIFVSNNHPLAGQGTVTPEDFIKYPHVSVRISEYQEKPFASKIAKLLADRDILLSTSDLHLALEVVSHSDALMIGTRSLGLPLMERYQLKALNLPPVMSELYADYRMTWHRLRHRDRAHQWFRSVCLEECEKLRAESGQILTV